MGLIASAVLIGVGAVLYWAAGATIVGVVLIAAGAAGLVLSLVFWSSWGGFGGGRRTLKRTEGAR